MGFIKKYGRVDGSEDEDDSVAGDGEVKTYSDDDEETNVQGQSSTDYRLMNVTRDLQEALLDQSMSSNLSECSDPENFASEHVEEIEYDFDTFDNFEKKIKKFEQQLQIFEQDSKDSFYLAIIYATFYALLKEIEDFEFCKGEGKLTRIPDQSFFEELAGKRENLQLDLSLLTFQVQCHVMKDLTKRLFLGVYELRKKFSLPSKKKFSKRKMLSRGIFRPVLGSVSMASKLLENLQKIKVKKIFNHLTLLTSLFQE